MAHLKSVFFLATLQGIIAAACGHTLKVNGKVGQNVLLKCLGPTHSPIEVVKWIKPDLKSDHYVFFYRERQPVKSYQHEHFEGRVELSDPQMKEGDVSVILKNLTIDDAGRYECEISVSSAGRVKRAPSKLFCSIDLHVDEDAEESRFGQNARFLTKHQIVIISIATVVTTVVYLF